MKKNYLAVFTALTILLLTSSVLAVTECAENQIIFKTSDTTNAHASLYNDAEYTNSVCYSSIYGRDQGGADTHACKAGNENVVVWLSADNNAHLATEESVNYASPVCFGDLECHAINADNGESCLDDETIIASLSATTNAHVAEGDDAGYPIKICCSSGPVLTDDSIFFANNNGEAISEAGINDLTRLTVSGENLEGRELDFTIYKQEELLGIDFLSFDTVAAQTTGVGFAKWIAGDNGNGTIEDGNYYFEVSVEGDTQALRSSKDNSNEDLRFLEVTSPGSNEPPVAKIITPKDKQIYFIDTNISFSQSSYDEDDEFSYVWTLDGINIANGTSETFENYNFTYFMTGVTNLGQHFLTLTVTDARGLTSTDWVTFLVVNADSGETKYILTYIDSPENGGFFGRVVEHDARSTYSINTMLNSNNASCSIDIICAAGNCPEQSVGLPNPSTITECDYNSTDPVPVLNAPQPYDDITFCWEFDNGVSGSFCLNGSSGASFDKVYSFVGHHTSTLNASINPSSEFSSEFTVSYNNDTCIVVEQENQANFPGLQLGRSYWLSSGQLPTDSQNDCRRDGGIDSNGEPKGVCCPNGYSCNDDNECVYDLETSCDDYKTRESCEASSGHGSLAGQELSTIVEDEFPGGCSGYNVPFGDFCYEYLDCKCEWDDGSSTCEATSNHKVGKISNSIETWDHDSLPSDIKTVCNAATPTKSGKCTFEFNYEGSCLDGDEFVTRSWTAFYENNAASWNDVDYCQDGQEVIPCERVVRLPFFTLQNIIIAIIIIAIIYYFILRKKKK